MQRENTLTLNIWIQIKHNEFGIKLDGVRWLCGLFCWIKMSVSRLKDVSTYLYEQSQTLMGDIAGGLQRWLHLATTECQQPWPLLVHDRESPIVFKWVSPLPGSSIFLGGAELLCWGHLFTLFSPRETEAFKQTTKRGRKAFSGRMT